VRYLFSLRYLIIILALFLFLFGCAVGEKIVPLESPPSNIINELKSYSRYEFNGHQKTNQEVEKGDMVLVFTSGAGGR
jgi:hypothetical protein